jgi:hypothetical protein
MDTVEKYCDGMLDQGFSFGCFWRKSYRVSILETLLVKDQSFL